jgi:hypothetical protein
MTKDFGVASRRILQLFKNQVNHLPNPNKPTYHSSSSTLKVLALENILSYAPMRVRIVSIGQSLNTRQNERHRQFKHDFTERLEQEPACRVGPLSIPSAKQVKYIKRQRTYNSSSSHSHNLNDQSIMRVKN